MTTDVDAMARECVIALKCDSSQHPTLADDEHVFEQAIATALRERDAEWQAEISRLTELPDDVRSCGELSCDDCNARTAQLRAEVERLRGELLRASPFGTLDEARQFIEWYEQAEHVTDWDKTRAEQAACLLGVRKITTTT